MFKVIKKDEALGAYIEDIDLSMISKETSTELLSCLAENEVLFFRNQNISPKDHKRFASFFGNLQTHPAYPTVESFQSAEKSLLNEQSNYLEVTHWWIDFFRYQFKTQ